MKTKALSVLGGISVPLILAGTAHAGFVGISVVTKAPGGGLPANSLVCNVFATFTRPGQDLFLSAAGTPASPMNISVIGGTFYQNQFGSDKAPNCTLICFPSQAVDTFVTIGVKKVGAPGGQPQDVLNLTPGWPGFTPTALTGTNLGWAVTPNDAQADPFNTAYVNGNGQVLIGQFTVANPLPSTRIHGFFRVLVRSNNVATQFNVKFDHAVPSPGALALLGTAGLIGTRRRRRV